MSFSELLYLGNAFGPGKTVVTCLACGAVVLDEAGDQQLHEAWHAATDPEPAQPNSVVVA